MKPHYLIQYTKGEVQMLMKSCLTMKDGFQHAKKMLEDKYGRPYIIAAAYIKRIDEAEPLKAEDSNGLREFSANLAGCINILKEIGCSSKLESPENMRKIISKLPFRLRLAWKDSVDRIIQKEKRDVNINDMSEFIADKARATTHPVFGVVEGSNKPKQQGQKGAVYAQQGKPNSAPNSPTCPLCSHGHFLPRCETFKKMSLGGRLNVIKEKRLCRNCLTPGHFASTCSKNSFCKLFSDKHSTFLHPTKSATTPANAAVKSPEAKDKLNMAADVKGSRIGLAVVPLQQECRHLCISRQRVQHYLLYR
ncbi:uncharacterized protein LOC117120473 [Anneissia japonica]|uniref:uncharacterized protein LOC117120473 n=1 Tax=Anneissia japonica TaxID=1529436 RepID=UPI0014255EED|nr:uncharacterized protein LOC117120473 [Anneissia japonica]